MKYQEGKEMFEFDPHAAIKRLAEITWECPCEGSGFEGGGPCPEGCDGTGRIVPFVSLWIPDGLCNGDGLVDDGNCPRCGGTATSQGRGWVPEPDVEKACWRICVNRPEVLALLTQKFKTNPYKEYEVEEALLRAAEAWAWVKEQMHGR